jgi:hypothetical protein
MNGWSQMPEFRALPAADTAFVVEFGDQIERRLSTRVLAPARRDPGGADQAAMVLACVFVPPSLLHAAMISGIRSCDTALLNR